VAIVLLKEDEIRGDAASLVDARGPPIGNLWAVASDGVRTAI
jgi:hypothetical protein